MRQELAFLGSIELKIAIRNLLKRRTRTFFTLIAIILGVSIFFAVNVAMESLERSLFIHLDNEDLGNVNKWVYMIKSIFTILSAISLIICVIIIKNLMEMTKEDQIYELGLLRAIGSPKYSIFLTFFFQVLVIAIIGTILGLIFGYFFSYLLFNPLKNLISSFTSLPTKFEIYMNVSSFTILISIIAGMVIPLVFGVIPAISASRSKVVAALNPHITKRKTKSNSIRSHIIRLSSSILFITIGMFLLLNSFEVLLSFKATPDTQATIAVPFILFGALFCISGMILFGTILLPYIFLLFSVIFKPILWKMKKICYRNLVKRSRSAKNTFLMISIGLSFLITVNIAISSIEAGIIPGAHMRWGGDIILTNSGYLYHQTYIPLSTADYIADIDHVAEICAVKNSVSWDNGTICNGFGTGPNEYLKLLVLDTTSYVRMHSTSSIYEYQGEKSFYEFIHQLDENGTVILQQELASKIDKNEGDTVEISTSLNHTLTFPALKSNFSVMGIMDILPGIESSWYEYDDFEYYTAVISWNTYFNITGSNYSSTTGNFWINCDDPNNADIVRADIADLYQNLGSPWNSTYIDFENKKSYWCVISILDDIGPIREFVNLILIVIVGILCIAIIISVLGFITSMEMSVNQRRSEIGILRALGISKIQIIQMILGETLIICMASLIIGILCGLTTGFIISNVPFMAYLPVIYTIPWNNIIAISVFISVLSIIASVIPARKAVKLNITESIKKRVM